MSTRIDIVSGFLGAGKTTFIKKLIEEAFVGKKIVVIENEFGEIGMDGDLLRNSGILVKEIFSGCICCSLVGDFKQAIIEVIDKFSPDVIIIEPSGIGKASEIINSCLLCGANIRMGPVTTIVDARKYKIQKRNFKDFYNDQIICADIISLSKAEDLEEFMLTEIIEELEIQNPKAEIIMLPRNELNLFKWKENWISKKLQFDEIDCVFPNKTEGFESYSFVSTQQFSQSELYSKLSLFNSSSQYGEVLRVKGILNTKEHGNLKVDYTNGEINIVETDFDGIGRLCFIGIKLSNERISELFEPRWRI